MKKEDDRERMSDMELDRVVGGVNPAWLEVGALAHVMMARLPTLMG